MALRYSFVCNYEKFIKLWEGRAYRKAGYAPIERQRKQNAYEQTVPTKLPAETMARLGPHKLPESHAVACTRLFFFWTILSRKNSSFSVSSSSDWTYPSVASSRGSTTFSSAFTRRFVFLYSPLTS